MSGQIRVCMVTSYPPSQTGTGTYSSYLVDELSRIADVGVLKWNYSGLGRILAPVTGIFSLIRVMRDNDIVHVQYHLGDFQFLFLPVLCLLRCILGARVFLTLHEDYTNLPFSWLFVAYHRLFYACADVLIIHASAQRATITQRQSGRAVLIPHGVISRKAARNPGRGVVLLPGFINPWKGHDTAIRAFAGVVQKQSGARLIIAGKAHDRRYARKIQELAGELDLQDHVEFHTDFLPDKELWKLYRRAEICILPYRRITMSGILCHILSWGIPSVLSDLDSFREFTRGRAVYCRPDDHRQLSAKILGLLGSDELKNRMARDFKKLAEEYSWKNAAQKTLSLYAKEHAKGD
ncbi:MAG: glycosyltransferase [archaeon]